MLHPASSLYRVFHSCGAGTARGPAFKRLDDARRYVLDQRVPGSFAIRKPDGTWHEWGESGSPVFTVPAPGSFPRGTRVGDDMPGETRAPAAAPRGYPPGVPSVMFRK